MNIPVVYGLIADFALLRGVSNVAAMPGGKWFGHVDHNWSVGVNATNADNEIEPPNCMKATLSPWGMAVWWNGWLAGLIDPAGGCIAAHPSDQGANEDTLIAALERAMASESQP